MLPFRRFELVCLSLTLLGNGCTHRHQHEPFGAHPVDFLYWNPSAKNVFLAGNFNGWNTTSTPMHGFGKGDWQVQVALEPGRYQYKFIADGHWTQDPANSDSAPDLFGGKNSVITVNPGAKQDGQAERRRISAAAHRLLEARDFASIEKRADELRRSKRKLPQGRWELQPFYEGLEMSQLRGRLR